MLKINRIKAISKTEDADFGFDYVLKDGLNLISSNTNTRGKSSAILTIYYCLGFEEIIGGKGSKTLTSVYKTELEDNNGMSHNVLESRAWLEITNGSDTVTVMRAGKLSGRRDNLITVYYSDMDSVYNSDTNVEDMYVHIANSTTSLKGFHNFLEKFIGFELPIVPSNDGTEYKLYMQLLFSVIFIEQKRGWADLFSAMPILNIKDAKKRVIEYLIGLDTLAIEKKRTNLKINELDITKRWDININEIFLLCSRENCKIGLLPVKPEIIENDFLKNVQIYKIDHNLVTIDEEINQLRSQQKELKGVVPKVIDNYEQLQEELEKTEIGIRNLENKLEDQHTTSLTEKANIHKLEENLEIINTDLRNNKDALKLKKLGSTLDAKSYSGICPVCGQSIADSLLPSQNHEHIMDIEENIRHLESQQMMILFAINAHKENRKFAEDNIQILSSKIFTLRRLATTIRNDLFSVDENLSETTVFKRIQIENTIQALINLKKIVNQKISDLSKLSIEWKAHLQEKARLPKSNFSEHDKDTVSTLDKYFKIYLQAFNYKSVLNYDSIQISEKNYLPTSEGFDMKFDSSASDNIRAIWAYTLALLRTSNEKKGNHPHIVMFDEPAQHSMVTDDVVSLFQASINMPGKNQIILGITLNDADIREAVDNFDKRKIHIIDVGDHAFKKIE
jgi:hypothetical protein